mgnify:CR=1 FL=1
MREHACDAQNIAGGYAMIPIEVNGPMMGIFLKELVRRAMTEIRNQRLSFQATTKMGYSGSMDDVFTTADTNAQAIFEKSIQEALPGVGLIGEEGLNIPCTIPGHDIYVTIDPLDGTKAFVRRQSHGVATMAALVVDGEIVSAWIGDINTREIFGFRPGGTKVHRISEFEISESLSDLDRNIPLKEGYVLLRESLEASPNVIRNTVHRFKKYHIDGGSIGTWFCRLWKGEYIAVITDPGTETPWDASPFIGISKRLGFVFLRSTNEGTWEQYEPLVAKESYSRDYYTMVVHSSMVEQFI